MPAPKPRATPYFTEAARKAAQAARAAKHAEPDRFGLPELFIVRSCGQSFTWELRRFGGVLLERGIEAFPNRVLAQADGEAVLATLCASPDLPTFRRDPKWELAPAESSRE